MKTPFNMKCVECGKETKILFEHLNNSAWRHFKIYPSQGRIEAVCGVCSVKEKNNGNR